jgi:protein dithiol oxidoreductase (disulfide-forming)
MICHELDTILDSHGTRALSAAERARVDAHLAGCARCAGAWFAEDLLLSEPAVTPPAGLRARVVAAAVTGSAAGSFSGPSTGLAPGGSVGARVAPPARLRSPIWLAAAAVLVAVVGGSFWLLAPERVGLQTVAGADVDTPTADGLLGASLERRFVEGRHYVRLPAVTGLPTAGERIEVVQFFMWPCFPCYSFEPDFSAWVTGRPSNIDVVRVPVLFNPLARLHAQAFYAAERLGMGDEMFGAFFTEFHDRGNRLDSEAALADFFARFGVGRSEFAAAFDSEPVRAALRDAQARADRFGINATPSVVVNGRFLATPQMAGSYGALVEVVDELVRLERANCVADSGCPLAGPAGEATPLDELLRRVEAGRAR